MSMAKVEQILEDAKWGFLSTCAEGHPRVRPMVFVLREDGMLWSSTYRQSGKMRELEHNPRVEICWLDSEFVQLRIEGVVDTTGGPEQKRALLEANPKVRNHFPDEHDPKFVHLAIRPTRIEYKPAGFGEYEVVFPPSE
jgi:uncharacterized pyridoxamine 5'-phosphate oxidase family protein